MFYLNFLGNNNYGIFWFMLYMELSEGKGTNRSISFTNFAELQV